MVKSHLMRPARSEVYHHPRSKMSRWCFSNLNQIPNSASNISLKTHPNYAISKRKILQGAKLPKNMNQEHLEISIDDQMDFRKDDKCISVIERSSQAIGQILLIFKPFKENADISIYSGSFFVIKDSGDLLGITALHCLQGSKENGEKYYFISFSDIDMTDFVHILIEQHSKRYFSLHRIVKEVLQNQFDLRLVESYSKDFLAHRNQWIKNPGHNLSMLDPVFHLKLSPAVDFMLFPINKEWLTKMIIEPLKIAEPPKRLSRIFLVGYPSLNEDDKITLANAPFQNKNSIILNRDEANLDEYALTLPENFKKNKVIQIFVKDVINGGKTVSIGQLKSEPHDILIYETTAWAGQSGGALLNENGEVFGLQPGEYKDIEQQEVLEKQEEDEDSLFFDICLDGNKENLSRIKNVNIGISMINSCYLDFKSLSVKPKHNFLFPESNEKNINQESAKESKSDKKLMILDDFLKSPKSSSPNIDGDKLLKKRKNEEQIEEKVEKKLHQQKDNI